VRRATLVPERSVTERADSQAASQVFSNDKKKSLDQIVEIFDQDVEFFGSTMKPLSIQIPVSPKCVLF